MSKKPYQSKFAAKKRAVDQASRSLSNDHCFNTTDQPIIALRNVFESRIAGVPPCIVFRIWPEVMDDGDFAPYRVGPDLYQISDFIAPAAKVLAGPPEGEKVSFHVAAEDGGPGAEPDPWQLFSKRLFRRAKSEDAPQELLYLFPNVNKKQGERREIDPIPMASSVYYVQGHVLLTGLKDGLYDGKKRPPLGLGQDDPTPVIQLTGNTGDKLLKTLAQPMPKITSDVGEDDWERRCLYGDPVSPDRGKFIHIYNAKVYTPPFPDEVRDSLKYRPLCESSSKFSEYAVVPMKNAWLPGGTPKSPLTAVLDGAAQKVVKKRFIPWSKLLRVPEREEMAVLIARTFSQFPFLFEWAWSDQRDLLAAARPYLVDRTISTPGSGSGSSDPAERAAALNKEAEAWADVESGGSGEDLGDPEAGDSDESWVADAGDGDEDLVDAGSDDFTGDPAEETDDADADDVDSDEDDDEAGDESDEDPAEDTDEDTDEDDDSGEDPESDDSDLDNSDEDSQDSEDLDADDAEGDDPEGDEAFARQQAEIKANRQAPGAKAKQGNSTPATTRASAQSSSSVKGAETADMTKKTAAAKKTAAPKSAKPAPAKAPVKKAAKKAGK